MKAVAHEVRWFTCQTYLRVSISSNVSMDSINRFMMFWMGWNCQRETMWIPISLSSLTQATLQYPYMSAPKCLEVILCHPILCTQSTSIPAPIFFTNFLTGTKSWGALSLLKCFWKKRIFRDEAQWLVALPSQNWRMGQVKPENPCFQYQYPPWNFLERIRQPGLSVSAWFFRDLTLPVCMGPHSLWRRAGYDSLENHVLEAFFLILEP